MECRDGSTSGDAISALPLAIELQVNPSRKWLYDWMGDHQSLTSVDCQT